MAKTAIRTSRQARAVEEKYIGAAPVFKEGISSKETLKLINDGLRHYAYFYNTKEGMKWVVKYLKETRKWTKEMIDEYAAAEVWKTNMTICAVARMITDGAVLSPEHVKFMEDATDQIRNDGIVILREQQKEEEQTKKSGPVLTIQDRLRAKADKIAVEFEGRIDDFIMGIDKDALKFDFYKHMRTEGFPFNQVKYFVESVEPLRNDLDEYINSKNPDPDISDGYGYLTKTQAKALMSFIDKTIADAGMFKEEAVVTRKPRVKKAKPVSKIVEKLKFLKKDEKLKLVSVKPTDIVGAEVLWVYNTKTRKLGKFVASPGDKLGVKGTAIVNFDESQSVQKTLRKPVDQLKGFTKLGKIKLRTFLEDIKAIDTKLRPRLNAETILLKVQ